MGWRGEIPPVIRRPCQRTGAASALPLRAPPFRSPVALPLQSAGLGPARGRLMVTVRPTTSCLPKRARPRRVRPGAESDAPERCDRSISAVTAMRPTAAPRLSDPRASRTRAVGLARRHVAGWERCREGRSPHSNRNRFLPTSASMRPGCAAAQSALAGGRPLNPEEEAAAARPGRTGSASSVRPPPCSLFSELCVATAGGCLTSPRSSKGRVGKKARGYPDAALQFVRRTGRVPGR